MDKYILDFFDDVVAGKYGRTKITRLLVSQFVDKVTKEELDAIEDFYWEWTSELCEPEDIVMADLEAAFLPIANRR